MKIYNRTLETQRTVLEFERLCSELGTDDGFIEVGYGEYFRLLRHYNIKPPRFWQGWPKIKGVTVIREGLAK